MLVLAVFPRASGLSSFRIRAMWLKIRRTVRVNFQTFRTLVPLLKNSVPNQAKAIRAFFWVKVPNMIIRSIHITKENSILVSRCVTPKSINHPSDTNSSKFILHRTMVRTKLVNPASLKSVWTFIM